MSLHQSGHHPCRGKSQSRGRQLLGCSLLSISSDEHTPTSLRALGSRALML